jgi:hypothetical protein
MSVTVIFQSLAPDNVLFAGVPIYQVEIVGMINGVSEGGGDAAEFVFNETPNGLVNGSNASFTTDFDFVPESVQVFAGVARLSLLDDYNTSGVRTITLFQSPLAGENIRVSYIKQ